MFWNQKVQIWDTPAAEFENRKSHACFVFHYYDKLVHGWHVSRQDCYLCQLYVNQFSPALKRTKLYEMKVIKLDSIFRKYKYFEPRTIVHLCYPKKKLPNYLKPQNGVTIIAFQTQPWWLGGRALAS